MPRYSVILGNLGNTCDRFLSTGYKNQPSKEIMIRQASEIEGVEGIELVGSWDIDEHNADQIGDLLGKYNLSCVSIIPDLFSQKKWGTGSIASKDPDIRAQAMDYLFSICEISRKIGCSLINIWPGQDGYDYCLQANYLAERQIIIENIKKLAFFYPDLRFSLEYKLKEPRTHSFLARASDTLLVAMATELPNVGVTIDTGHALFAYENMAESAVMLDMSGKKLFHLHFNDNYRYWDDDMIVGSVHLVEYVELLYWLKNIDYNGWYSMDQYPYREDGKHAIEESVKFIQAIERKLTPSAMKEIDNLLAEGKAVESQKWFREFIFS